nr:hypothetical protein [Candidatus Sigynarchaeota archaeon]
MKTSWEVQTCDRVDYLDITHNEVVIGGHYGSPFTDIAGSCSHEEFLAGKFQDLVLERFGNQVLQEAIKVVQNAGDHEPFKERRATLEWIKSNIELLAVNDALKDVLYDASTINGYLAYGNAGGYKTTVKSDTFTLFVERTSGYTEGPDQRRHPFSLRGHCSAAVELHDRFFVIHSDNFGAISSTGTIDFDTTSNRRTPLFGEDLRLTNVFRTGTRILVAYAWLNTRNGNPGIFEYVHGTGFTSRCSLLDD